MRVIRSATVDDFEVCHVLYKALVGEVDVPEGPSGRQRFAEVITHPGTTVFVADVDGVAVSMATLHLLPNMTYGGRPYAMVENVVTLKSHRGQGTARAVMNHIADVVWAADGYKIMLLTGRTYGARGFYEALGYTAEDKFGMVLRRVPPRKPS